MLLFSVFSLLLTSLIKSKILLFMWINWRRKLWYYKSQLHIKFKSPLYNSVYKASLTEWVNFTKNSKLKHDLDDERHGTFSLLSGTNLLSSNCTESDEDPKHGFHKQNVSILLFHGLYQWICGNLLSYQTS